MHKQVSALLSAGGSPGKLAAFGIALGGSELDIKKIGGAEWLNDGPVTLILREDGEDKRRAFEGVCARLQLPWLSFPIVAVELADVQGSLGAMAAVLGNNDINIYSVLLLEPTETMAVVGLGIRPSKVEDALRALRTAQPNHYTATVLQHGDDPNDGAEWDARTEDLLPRWEDPNASKDDPAFWQVPGQGA